MFIGRSDAEAEAPVLWQSDTKSQLNSLAKILMLGNIEGKRRKGRQRMRWLDDIIDSMDLILSKFREIVKDRKAWPATVQGFRRVRHD